MVHLFDNNKIYIKSISGDVGNYSNSTEISPPDLSESEIAVFDETKNNWIKRKCYKGKLIYGINGGCEVCRTDDIPEGWQLTPVVHEFNLQEYKSQKLNELSSESIKSRDKKFNFDVNLRIQNLLLRKTCGDEYFPDYNIDQLEEIADAGNNCRKEYYRLKALIDAATNKSQVDAAVDSANF